MRGRATAQELELVKAMNHAKEEKSKETLQFFKNTVMRHAYLRDPKLLAELNKVKILN